MKDEECNVPCLSQGWLIKSVYFGNLEMFFVCHFIHH